MFIITIILISIIVFLSVIYLSNSIPALMQEIKRNPDNYIFKGSLIYGGISMFLIIVGFVMLCVVCDIQKDRIKELQNNQPKYEVVTETFYKQIK